MTKHIVLVLGIVLAGCSDRVVYVYADGGTPDPTTDAALPLGDAQSPPDDTTPPTDVPDAAGGLVDAPSPVEGACLPDRIEGEVSHADCRGLATPVCDAITERCVAEPTTLCGACETDAQCQAGVSLRAACVFLPGDAPSNNDSACMLACDSEADCAHLGDDMGCLTFARGTFCARRFFTGPTHCRTATSTRIAL